jgi:PAS domain S-box-containing protein
VTARKQAEAALHESRERVQAIIDNTPAVISVKDADGRYTLVNRSFEMLFGIDRQRAAGRTDAELFPAELAGTMRANDLRVMREQVPLQVEEVMERADGPHTYLSAKFPLRDPEGERTRSARSPPTSRSASARRQRCASPSCTSAASSTRPTTFVSLDDSGRITAWNPQAEQMFGWGEQEAVGRSFAETLIPARSATPHARPAALHGDGQRRPCSTSASRTWCAATGTSSWSR